MTSHDDAHRGLGLALLLIIVMLVVYAAIGLWIAA